jgi:hypothetical protein
MELPASTDDKTIAPSSAKQSHRFMWLFADFVAMSALRRQNAAPIATAAGINGRPKPRGIPGYSPSFKLAGRRRRQCTEGDEVDGDGSPFLSDIDRCKPASWRGRAEPG